MSRRWDLFCRVIDNHGDLGVCWRLAAQLAARGERVRLWCDDASALRWMAPEGAPGVQPLAWPQAAPAGGVGDVVVEAFGCDPPPLFVAAMARRTPRPLWINLEYLSAESYVERCHRLPSPLSSGPGAGLTRWFFYPGLTPATGGLLRERDLAARQQAFDRAAWRARHGVGARELAIVLFCYEPPALAQLLAQLRQQTSLRLLVTPGRAAAAVRALGAPANAEFLPYCSQPQFDELLWACTLNFVRGEDSLVRALWAGQPFVWQIYAQHDDAHHAKLSAFLDWLQAPASLRRAHASWNALPGAPGFVLPAVPELASWGECVRAARARLLQQPDLVTALLGFVAEKS